MNRVRVKICGVRTLEEARAAVDFGADALGFNFWPRSPRYVSAEEARSIIERVFPLVPCVGVFVNEEPSSLIDIARTTRISLAQLHGDETPEYCRGIESIKLIKALRVGPNFDVNAIETYPVSAVLLDAGVKGSFGGTGRSFDWQVAIEAKRRAPIILAGGLNVDNVAEAITSIRPVAIDVCSGVEAKPGRKDLEKLEKFMREVASANRRMEEHDK
jgi:phosphoribosylanthranilate isomerase